MVVEDNGWVLRIQSGLGVTKFACFGTLGENTESLWEKIPGVFWVVTSLVAPKRESYRDRVFFKCSVTYCIKTQISLN